MTADLITRLESADGPSGSLLLEAAKAVWVWDCVPTGVNPDAWVKRWNRFHRMLDAEAWTSAAEMLVPEGWTYEGRQGPSAFPHMWTLSTIKCGDVRYTTATGRARFAALALAAAALKARGV